MSTENLKSELPGSFTFSQSSLQDYVTCPRRFQLRYIEQLAWPAIETEPVIENERRQQEGQLFHRMVQQRLIGLPAEKLTRLASTADLRRWWDNYLAEDINEPGCKNYIELTLTAPFADRRLLAKYDMVIVKPDGQAVIFDWKTYHKRPKDEWMAARLQTRLYPALLIQAGAHLNNGSPFQPGQVELIYWYAEFPSEPAHFPYTAVQHERNLDFLAGLIHEILDRRHFPPAEDEKKCAFCPYRSFCDRGVNPGCFDEMVETESDTLNVNFEEIQEIEF